MSTIFSRRSVLQATAAAAVSVAGTRRLTAMSMPMEGPGTPKICLEVGAARVAAGSGDEASMRRIKQLGVDYVLMTGPRLPWEESELRARMDRFKAGGLTVGNMFMGGFPNTTYGKPGRDEEIEKIIQSVRAAGRAGLPVIEYNFYAHRATEGYYEEKGRAGSGYTAFDYEKKCTACADELMPTSRPHSRAFIAHESAQRVASNARFRH